MTKVAVYDLFIFFYSENANNLQVFCNPTFKYMRWNLCRMGWIETYPLHPPASDTASGSESGSGSEESGSGSESEESNEDSESASEEDEEEEGKKKKKNVEKIKARKPVPESER